MTTAAKQNLSIDPERLSQAISLARDYSRERERENVTMMRQIQTDIELVAAEWQGGALVTDPRVVAVMLGRPEVA